jgi:DNA helicase-2/ATP-dependent DNA helicase PcrA
MMVPQRFFTHNQATKGDRHVYAARTRFIPSSLLSLFERASWPAAIPPASRSSSQAPRVDIGARMRGMWR